MCNSYNASLALGCGPQNYGFCVDWATYGSMEIVLCDM